MFRILQKQLLKVFRVGRDDLRVQRQFQGFLFLDELGDGDLRGDDGGTQTEDSWYRQSRILQSEKGLAVAVVAQFRKASWIKVPQNRCN